MQLAGRLSHLRDAGLERADLQPHLAACAGRRPILRATEPVLVNPAFLGLHYTKPEVTASIW